MSEDRQVLELALREMSLALDALAAECTDTDGKPKAPSRQVLMRSRGLLAIWRFLKPNRSEKIVTDEQLIAKQAKRGISASLMYEVVSMWNWILEEGLEDFDDYAQYGLPLFKATAVKYGFDNPIGDDDGDEFKYSSECDD